MMNSTWLCMPTALRRRGRVVFAAAMAVIASTYAAGSSQASRSPDGGEVVRLWNEVTTTTLTAAGTPVPEQPLYLAYVHQAVYDGVLVAKNAQRRLSFPAVVTAAAHTVLVTHFPSQKAVLDQKYAASVGEVRAGPARAISLAIGRVVAEKIIRERAADGRNGPVRATPRPGPGVWVPTPPNTIGASSWLGAMRPFVLRSPAQFRPPVPPAMTTGSWAVDYNETKALGSATSVQRTAQQTEVARFWSDPPYVQNQKALRAYAQRHQLGTIGTARLFALADTAAADALIACWDAKFHYAFWRPFSAIPAGDTDGNPATSADALWKPLLPTPNFPEHPSAHSCSTTAIVTVLKALAPNGELDLEIDSVNTGTARHFHSADLLLQEVANARVWGGLHWRFSTEAGTRVGASVGTAVIAQHCARTAEAGNDD